MSEGTLHDRYDATLLAHRLVQLGILLSVGWKISYFHWSLTIYESHPIDHDFFPNLFRSNVALFIAYASAVAASTVGVLTGDYRLKWISAVVSILSLTFLCLHQGTYNDATFTTSWWASVWTMWFVTRMNHESETTLMPKAAFLGRAIVSMVLLGGAVGKWTSEYWSGVVFHDIYFVDRPFWTFNYLRSNFDAEMLPEIAKWYSRGVVIIETIAGLGLWLLPARIAAITGVVLLASIAVFSNFLLFSVMFALIGLAAVGLLRNPSRNA